MAFRRTKISSRRSAVGVSQFLITSTTNESPLALDQQAHVISRRDDALFFLLLGCRNAPRRRWQIDDKPFARHAQDVGWKCSWCGLFGERSGELVFSGGHFVPCVTISLAQKVNSRRLC